MAVVAIATTMIAGPALARDGYHRGFGGPGAAVAAGIAGVAIGAGLAAASSPYRDSYAYYGDDGYAPSYYAPSYGYARGNRGGSTWNSDAGAGGYNTGATSRNYNGW